jgi:hypothetical protein
MLDFLGQRLHGSIARHGLARCGAVRRGRARLGMAGMAWGGGRCKVTSAILQ